MKRNILCYGDSNTFGTNPSGLTVRHPQDVRWTGRLRQLLGEKYHIIEEGLGGRTTAWNDPLESGRNGYAFLPTVLQSHRPLDLVILFLGTNDCKSIFNAQPVVIARGAERLIETIRSYNYGAGIKAPEILLVSPIWIGEQVMHTQFVAFDENAVEKSKQLALYYAQSAQKYGCAFLDASAVAGPGPDQLHMDEEGHKALAQALAVAVRKVFGEEAEEEIKYTFDDLVHIIEELRSDHGCPWDKAQTYESLKVCLADESQEVFDAIDNHDMENLCEELGDVLLQVLLNSQIAREEGVFTIEDVIEGLCQKMIRRHPHVFGDVKVNSPEESLALWNEIKKQEKAEKP